MEIIINAGKGTKRRIKGPYDICGSREDIQLLYNTLKNALETDKTLNYGWIPVHEAVPLIPNEAPIGWDE